MPYLLNEIQRYSKIIISQTRRIAAISAAKFLTKISNLKLGKKIGYNVRFDNMSDKETKIKFVTDGIFFQELIQNPSFTETPCFIIDEFHERTIYTDLILGIIKKIAQFRKNIKIILMSASGDSDKMARFFQKGIGKIKIPGKLFKTLIYYTKFSQKDFISSICSTIVSLHSCEKTPGNILVFLPGQEEIEEVFLLTNFILQKTSKNFQVVKLYASLHPKEQTLAFNFQPKGVRKIILATNIAESSVTIPGTRIVIDCGLSKQKISNWKTGIHLLKTFPISKSQAIQRAGRSSREEIGKCFRLYEISEYKKLSTFPKPEIQKVEISSVLLQLFCYNSKNIIEIDLVDWPSQWELKRSLELLFAIGALDYQLKITQIGKLISVFPLDVKLSRCIIEALKDGDPLLVNWMLVSSSVLSMDFNSKIENALKKFRKIRFEKSEKKSDHFFLASWFFDFFKSNDVKRFDNTDGILPPYQGFWDFTKNIQLHLKKISEAILPFFKNNPFCSLYNLPFFSKFCFCFTSGFFLNVARIKKNNQKFYCLSSGVVAEVHSSSIFKKNLPNLIIFHEIFISQKIFVREITPVLFSWLIFFGKRIFI